MVPPPGGKGDTEGPSVISVFPEDGVPGVDTGIEKIRIQFDEWVRGESFDGEVFVLPPEPYMERKYGHDFLELYPRAPLNDSTTYIITIGGEVSDYRRNKMTRSYTLAFATGDSIDMSFVKGHVTIDGGFASPFMGLYDASGSNPRGPDEFLPVSVCTPSEEGDFEFRNIKPGRYYAAIFGDMNKDFYYDSNEPFGLSPGAFNVGRKEIVSGIRITAGAPLPPPLRMQGIVPFDSTFFGIRFTGSLDGGGIMEKAEQTRFYIEKEKIPVSGTFFDPGRPDILFFSFSEGKYAGEKCLALADAFSGEETDSLEFPVPAAKDSTAPEIRNLEPDNSGYLRLVDTFSVVFSEPVSPASLQGTFRLFVPPDTADTSAGDIDTNFIALSFKNIKRNEFLFTPKSPLPPSRKLVLKINPLELSDANGNYSPDSAYHRSYMTGSPDSLKASVEGIILRSGREPLDYYIYLEKVSQGRYLPDSVYKVSCPAKDSCFFKIGSLPGGKYLIEAFEDSRPDGEYDRGSIVPFRYPEKRYNGADTVFVRPGWTTEGIIVDFSGPETEKFRNKRDSVDNSPE
ncbi:MAG: Ig-like domain-containing protein [Fibrobacterota bacterium]